MRGETPAAAGTAAPDRSSPRRPRLVRADELLGENGQLQIDLDGEVYTLRLTRNHRLILTK